MITSEKQLEDYLFNSNRSDIECSGLYCFIHKQLFRQVTCGEYGIADLVSVSAFPRQPAPGISKIGFRKILVTIYELKLNEVNKDTFFQALKYQKALSLYCRSLNLKSTFFEFEIVLIGSSVKSKDSFGFLPDFLDNVQFYTYSIDNGNVKFQCQYDFQNKWGKGTHLPALDKISKQYLLNKKRRAESEW